MNFIKVAMLFVLSALIVGCATSPYPKITTREIKQHEKALQENYQKWLENEKPKKMVKWVQPANKTEPCEIYIGYPQGDDRTLKDGFEILWDGECRDGYAYGLGREFETSESGYLEAIAIYPAGTDKQPTYIYPAGTDKQPTYYYEKRDNDYFIGIVGKDARKGIYQQFQFDINGDIFMSQDYITSSPQEDAVVLVGATSPLSHSINFQKRFPTHTMVLTDHRENVFSELNWEWATYDKEGRKTGIASKSYKFKPSFFAEFEEDRMLRQVTVPSYLDESVNELREEVFNGTKGAQGAYQEGLEVSNKYVKKICGASITVDFMSNEKYWAICTERTKLFKKVEEQSEIYQAQYKEQKKVFEQQQQQFAEIQQRRKAQESAETLAALSGFVSGLAEAFNSYEHPTMPTPAPTTYTPRSSAGSSAGTSIYSPDECIGAVVNGRCVGTINPDPSNVLRKKCYGTVINGECIGPIRY